MSEKCRRHLYFATILVGFGAWLWGPSQMSAPGVVLIVLASVCLYHRAWLGREWSRGLPASVFYSLLGVVVVVSVSAGMGWDALRAIRDMGQAHPAVQNLVGLLLFVELLVRYMGFLWSQHRSQSDMP